MRIAFAGLLLALAATEAVAGAWPRPKGETFVSIATRQSTGARTLIAAVQDIHSYNSIYLEHGLTERLTVGLDAGQGRGPDEQVAAALVFARLPVWSPGEHKVAADLGFGLLEDDVDGTQTRIRPGLAWGRGFQSRRGDGWLGMEASWEYRLPSGDSAVKADFTAGLKPTDRWMAILQLQTGVYPDSDPIARLAPSVVRKLGARTHLQVGGLAPLAGDDAWGATLALWLTF
jgi:hypothetical protein